MKKPLWIPSDETKENANITHYIRFVNQRVGTNFSTYNELYRWSIDNIPQFWATVWDFVDIKASTPYQTVVDDLTKFPGAKWFVGAKLNYAQNLLRYADSKPALIFRGENIRRAEMTYAELRDNVARLALSLRDLGVKPGDRVVGYMPNLIETAVAMLATTSIGAVWSSCATDLGPGAALDRFGQVEPKVLFTTDGYFYKGKCFSTIDKAASLARGMPWLRKVIVVPYVDEHPDISTIPRAILYPEFLTVQGGEPEFEQVPFDHPLYIMFSSGTTGKPKCLVQSVGGVLINHLKELIIHTDLRREDVHFFITTCSWMMWNWIMSSLAVGNTLVLYDGNPNYPDAGAMWKLIEEENVTMFGCSATYINYLRHLGVQPSKDYDLSSLREIWQTGSPLSAEGFEYVYKQIKQDLHFNSSSGGTDINGCFCTGSPIQPVHAGELQGPALGMKIKAYDETGRPVYDRQGELVCEAPAPSMPLYFWNDPEGKKYRAAYFDFYKGKNVWRHGDYVVIHSDTGGITFYGRSDSVLKPSGVRIGTAEIYNQLEQFSEVSDSLAIGQNWKGDQRIILFVKLAAGFSLTEDLKTKIRQTLRQNASPRHVPAKIIEVPDIPYTLSMKKVESAVTNIINGQPVTNRDALVNPESLDYYERIRAVLQQD